ncbi:ABC transporter permease [Cellulomonas sp. S1-8]|uniref:ABC transporter permease n=1 Tax=Cellulomonas sp. S1-8 TaxID=2904790 RepID=UPI002242CF86|nr:ABC transporter permease [Cellulomonas sp. S1-8]UZN04858.1 ABC transporter permease [Cellulomonas sp. S1-8]
MSRARLSAAVVPVFASLGFVFLLVPVAYTVLFSFNDAGKTNLSWQGFTLDAWRNPCGAPRVCEALVGSLQVGLVSTLVATTLGTLLAIALVRARFRGRGPVNLLVFLPMATPEVVLGAALVSQFLSLRLPLGFWTVVVAHVLFCLSFVVVAVKARVATLDPALEQAAADLYATPWQAFWRVTFPLLLPGIGAAALLAFSLSFDDFIVTNFTSGGFATFPKFVYVSATRGIPPQANVISSAMFVLALLVVAVVAMVSRARRRG